MTASPVAKPIVRVTPGGQLIGDSFENLEARLGIRADNQSSGSTYRLNPVGRNRQLMEWLHRGSWLIGAAVDHVADDMTRAGVDFSSAVKPEDVSKLQKSSKALIWPQLNATVKWSRLYGGAVAVMLIDGHDVSTPLDPETIRPGQFKGLLALDRWMVFPTINEPVTELGPDLGKPLYYRVTQSAPAFQNEHIHYSRVVRMDGVELPYWQAMAENGWGMSVVERIYDRVLAFDSTTQGAAQLAFKAHLRTLKIKGLTEILGGNATQQEVLAKRVAAIRRFQSNEGVTLLDDTDTFETHSYTFAGLDDLIMVFAQQLSGSLEIPLVRLLGQSPAGLNSTGESDLRNYYDGINAKQNARLKRPLSTVFDLLHRSELGKPPADDFDFEFEPLWQLSDSEKAEIAGAITTAVTTAFTSGAVTSRATILRELKQSSDVTGVWSNVSDEEIDEAEDEPPPVLGEGLPGDDPDAGVPKSGAKADKPDDGEE